MNEDYMHGTEAAPQGPRTSANQSTKTLDPAPSLIIKDVSLCYGTHKALDNVSLSIPPGTLTALIGPNGAGKSSLVKTICGRIPPDEGTITINGRASTERAARITLGVAPQRAALYDQLSAEENLICFARQAGVQKLVARQRVKDVLLMIGLSNHASVRISQMSGGMRQRVNIAAAIMHEPKLLILDEPAANLDPQGVTQISRLIEKLKTANYAILLITHDMEQANLLADNVVILTNGRVKAAGAPQHLINKLCGDFARLTIATTDSSKLKTFGFIADIEKKNIWTKTFPSRTAALQILSDINQVNIPIDHCTLSTPSLREALDVSITSSDQSESAKQ